MAARQGAQRSSDCRAARSLTSLGSRGGAPGRDGLLSKSTVLATLQACLRDTLPLARVEEAVSCSARRVVDFSRYDATQ